MSGRKNIDLTGMKFGMLTVINQAERLNNQICWNCICDCGNSKVVLGNLLRNGKTKSCGCLRNGSKIKDIVGKQFGRLTVVSLDSIKTNKKQTYWLCKCNCGNPNLISVSKSCLLAGKRSCGCLHKEVTTIKNKQMFKKYNTYDLSGGYGIGYTLKGDIFYFDLEDYDRIKYYCWRINMYGYVVAKREGSQKEIRLHRLVMNVDDEDYKKVIVDHIDHTKFDNRKFNLRIASHSQNSMNKTLLKNNKTGVTGVNYAYNKYNATISINNKDIFLGAFDSLNEAVIARKKAEEKYFGEFSYDNSMKNQENININ